MAIGLVAFALPAFAAELPSSVTGNLHLGASTPDGPSNRVRTVQDVIDLNNQPSMMDTIKQSTLNTGFGWTYRQTEFEFLLKENPLNLNQNFGLNNVEINFRIKRTF